MQIVRRVIKNESSFFAYGKNGGEMVFEPHELRSMIRAQRQRLCAAGIHSANKLAESCVIWRVVRQIADNLFFF